MVPNRRADGRWSRHLRPLLLQPRRPLPSRRPLRARRFRRRRDGSRASMALTLPGSEGPDREARSSRTTSSRPRRPRADQRSSRAGCAVHVPLRQLVLLRRRPAATGPADAVTSIGRIMAERTTQSWTTVPHFFVARDVDATALNATREGSDPGDREVARREDHPHRPDGRGRRARAQAVPADERQAGWERRLAQRRGQRRRWRWRSKTPSSPR